MIYSVYFVHFIMLNAISFFVCGPHIGKLIFHFFFLVWDCDFMNIPLSLIQIFIYGECWQLELDKGLIIQEDKQLPQWILNPKEDKHVSYHTYQYALLSLIASSFPSVFFLSSFNGTPFIILLNLNDMS